MKKLLKNEYFMSLFTKATLVVIGLMTSVLINRFLGPSLKGEYAYLLNIINIVVLILNLGVYQSYPYLKRNSGQEVKNQFFNIFIMQFCIYMVIAVLLCLVLNKTQYLLIFTLTPLLILTKQLNFISLVEDINLRNKLNIGNQLFYVVVLLLIYMLAPQSIYYVFVALYTKEIFFLVRMIYKYKYKFSYKLVNKQILIKTLSCGFFPMLSALLITMNYSIDIIILKYFVDFELIGYYSVGVALANQVWLIPDAFKEVLFSRTARNDSIDDIKLSIKINLYISVFVILFITILGRKVIYILYGAEFVPAYSVTIVIFLGIMPMIFYKMIISLYNANSKQKLSFVILFASVIINVILNFIMIPLMSIMGAAVASVLSYTLCGILFTYTFMQEYGVNLHDLFLLNKDELIRLRNAIKVFEK